MDLNPISAVARLVKGAPRKTIAASMSEEFRGAIEEQHEKALSAPPAQPNLKRIDLPLGDTGSLNLGWFNNGAQKLNPQEWLGAGFDGIEFVGRGVGKTHLRCTSWDGNTVTAIRQAGTVRLANLTLHSGYEKALHFGQQCPPGSVVEPRFKFEMVDCEAIVDPPDAYGGSRPKWLLFGYQYDEYLKNCKIDAFHAREHARYRHGSASKGSTWEDVEVIASGAEGHKVRSDATETQWVGRNVWNVLRRVTLRNWYQPLWSDRGGAAVVGQGTGENWLLENVYMHGGEAKNGTPAHLRSRGLMLTSEGDSYDTLSGVVDKVGGYGNGWIVLRQCAWDGGPGPSWYALCARVGRQAGCTWAARGVHIEECGAWGDHMYVGLDSLPPNSVTIRGCNTPVIREYCRGVLGMNTTHEAVILTRNRAIPLSEFG